MDTLKIGNGTETKIENDKKTYKAHLQLPNFSAIPCDKEYHLEHICDINGIHTISCRCGNKGSTTQSTVTFTNCTLEESNKIYEKLRLSITETIIENFLTALR